MDNNTYESMMDIPSTAKAAALRRSGASSPTSTMNTPISESNNPGIPLSPSHSSILTGAAAAVDHYIDAKRISDGSNGLEFCSSPLSPPSPSLGSIDLRRQLCNQNVFVFHLPSEWTEDELRREFGLFGSILSCKVVKRPGGSSKGYGFVCYNDGAAAFQSVEAMNGRQYGTKRLKVSLKKTPEECLHLQVQKLMEISNANQPYDRARDCTLFFFHLPSSWDDKDIYQHFQPFGTLLSVKIAKKDNNGSRGYGFVTYDNPRAAALAIANMNGVEAGHNKRLKVQLKQQSSPPQPVPGCTIFIFHLPSGWTDNHLRQHFSHFGRILGSTVQRDSLGNSRGYGFVSFDRQRNAQNAVIGMNGFSVGQKRLKVSLKRGEDRYTQEGANCKNAQFFNTLALRHHYMHNVFIKFKCSYCDQECRITANSIFSRRRKSIWRVCHTLLCQDFNYWDKTATATAADFANAHAAHNKLLTTSAAALQQAFASKTSPQYTSVSAARSSMSAAVSDGVSHIIPQIPNYPSVAATGFRYPPATSAGAYSSYLPHWNAPADFSLGGYAS